MIRIDTLKVPLDLGDHRLTSVMSQARDVLKALGDNQLTFNVAIPLITNVVSVSHAPVYIVPEKCKLTEAKLAPDSTSGAYASTAFSLEVWAESDSPTKLAYIDRRAPSAPSWKAYKPVTLQRPGDLTLNPGDVLTLLTFNDGVIVSWRGVLSLTFTRVP